MNEDAQAIYDEVSRFLESADQLTFAGDVADALRVLADEYDEMAEEEYDEMVGEED